MTDAIVTDVPEDESQEPQGAKTKFDTDFEALVAKRAAEAEQEAQAADEPEAHDEDPVVEDQPPKKPSVPMIDLVDADGNTISVPATARYRAKVDGEEIEVPFEQLSRSYQKGAAADKRLEEASRALKEIESKQRELTEREQAFVQKQGELEQKRDEGKISGDAYRQAAKQLLAALTDEEIEDPEAHIAKIFAELNRPHTEVNAEAIAASAEKRALAKIEERERLRQAKTLEDERIKANKRFETEFKDVIEDPIAYNAAKSLATEKWRARPDAAPWEIASEVGNEIRQWKKQFAPSSPAPKPTAPRTVSARASIGKDPKPITRSDTLAEMKAARGQPV